MTIKQSAALAVVLGAVALSGTGCLWRSNDAPAKPIGARPSLPALPSPFTSPEETEEEIPSSDIDTTGWVRYESSQAGQIGMSLLYPPELSPVRWDTTVWGTEAVGVDFGGFGIARIPNADQMTIAAWLAKNHSRFSFDLSPVDMGTDPFDAAVTDDACEAIVVTDDFDEDAGLSGIGGTMFVNMGDASLYAFTLGQDWNQELDDREAVIREIMGSVEWFAEQAECPKTVTVRDDRVGIAFEIPRELAPVVITDEFGWGMEQGRAGGGPLTCLTNRIFLSKTDNASAVFLTVNDTWECEVPGRGGYWGDQAHAFATEAAIAQWCETKDACDSFINANGITVWHAYTKSIEDWDDTLTDVDEYAAWNPNRSIHAVLFSNQGFLKHGLGRQESTLREIANSLTFLE